jgi:hypothetical protein
VPTPRVDGSKKDPAGVAFRYEVLTAGVELTLENRAPGGKKKNVPNGEPTAIFYRKMRACSECPYSGSPISIVPAGRRSEWKVLTAPYVIRR